MQMSKQAVVKAPSMFDNVVDIIVPYYGEYDKVMNLIQSIFRLTRSNYYHLCLVDDYSPNAHYSRIVSDMARKRELTNFSVVRCDRQKGFGGACNEGLMNTDNEYVCFVHSDCRVEEVGWLRKMGETLMKFKDKGVRMVSPKTNNPLNGDPAQKGEKNIASEDIIIPDDSYLSTYCLLCHRELFNRCKGRWQEYPFGFYEDEEFAHRMKKKGFRQAVCGKSWIYHEGSATVKTVWKKSPGLKTIMEEENRRRCIEDMKSFKG